MSQHPAALRALAAALAAALLPALSVPASQSSRRPHPAALAERPATADPAPTADGLWAPETSKAEDLGPADVAVEAGFSSVFRLDARALEAALAAAPLARGASAKQPGAALSLPMPDGTLARFDVVEAPVVAEDYRAEFPELRAYRGVGVDDPHMTARFGVTPSGLNGVVRAPGRTVYVMPYGGGDPARYLSYDKRGRKSEGRLACGVHDLPEGEAHDALHKTEPTGNGEELRVYRLSLAATAEYTQFYGGTMQLAMNGLHDAAVKLNAVFEPELSITLQFVPKYALVYTAEPDGFTNGDYDAMIEENQAKADAIHGPSKYEIGHAFGRTVSNPGGRGLLPSAAQDGKEGMGASYHPNPKSDEFIDYVLHEMAHQFSAHHTYSATTCSGPPTADSAYEPGSGSTIMSYAGICDKDDNIQATSDDYFHVRSLSQIISYTTEGLGSAAYQTESASNSAPVVSAGPSFTIPRSTPFYLLAEADDAETDDLTYSWEQYDLGSTASTRPIIRSRPPSKSADRFIPNAENLFNGGSAAWDKPPTVNRLMHFRATVRDGQGGVAWDETTIRTTSSPFRVTAPGPGARWRKSTQQTVQWDVEDPKISTNVQISIFNGSSWIVVKESTPNDGVEPITVPNITTGNARVLVSALGSVFFAMSAGSLTVTGTGGSTVVSEGFEAGYPGWEKLHVNGSNWYRENKAAHGGSYRFTVGGGDYLGGTNTSLATPWFSVAGRSSVTMTFYAKYQTEPTADTLIVYAQVLGGPSGIPVAKWSGESASWPGWAPQMSVDASAAIAQAAGKPIRLVFGFKSDATVSGWGATIDDVKVTVQ